MKRKISCLNPISDKGLANLRDHYSITSEALDADAWLIRSANLLDTSFPDGLRAIGRAGAGVNNIPLERCAEEGIVVFNTPGANANAVSELVIASMILASRDIIGGSTWIREQEDTNGIAATAEKVKKRFVGTEIRSKVLGVIGLGAIGHLVANAAVGMGMTVLGYDPQIPIEYAWRLSRQVRNVSQLEELLPLCDYITIHVPLTKSSKHMISTRELALMKHNSILLNFSRDQLCDEEAVLHALTKQKLKQYVIDFPNEKNVRFPNTLVTPHLGASTEESEDNCAIMAVDAVQNYLDHGNISHSVNFPDVSLGLLTTPVRVLLLHRNVPGVINQMTSLFGENGYNIEQMLSNSRGSYAVAMFDVSEEVDRDFVKALTISEDILKIRVIRNQSYGGI